MKTGRTFLIIIITILLLGAGAYKIYTNQKKTEEETKIVASSNAKVPVNIHTAKEEKITDKYSSNGTLAPYQEVQLSAEIAGQVTNILVKEGDYVEKGETLATIKKDLLEVDYAKAQSNYRNALEDNQRYENAYKTGGITKQQLDQSRLQLENAENTLKQAEFQVGDSNVKTLISGFINKKNTETGAVVSPGTPLFDVVNLSQLKLKVTVGESQVTGLQVGDSVAVEMSIYPDKTFSGEISFIAPSGDMSLNYPVEVLVENNDGNDLRSGMYGTAHFNPDNKKSKQDYLVLPKDAFVEGVSSNEVFVVKKDSTVELTEVRSGKIFGDKVQVLNGIEPGTKVVTSGQINLIDGAKISIID